MRKLMQKIFSAIGRFLMDSADFMALLPIVMGAVFHTRKLALCARELFLKLTVPFDVFFRDINYLYDVFTLLLNYCSAIFYTVDRFPGWVQTALLCNPVYCYIKYFRIIVLDGDIPSLPYHLLCLFYAVVMVLIGGWIYKKNNHKFLYYM